MSEQGDVLQPSSPAERDKAPSRVLISESEISSLTPTEWVNRWHQQESYISSLERKLSLQEGEILELRQTNDKLRVQINDLQQREKVLVRRLTAKEQETQDFLVSMQKYQRQMFLTMCLKVVAVVL